MSVVVVTYCLLTRGNQYRCLEYRFSNVTHQEALAESEVRMVQDKGEYEVVDYRVEPSRYPHLEGGTGYATH